MSTVSTSMAHNEQLEPSHFRRSVELWVRHRFRAATAPLRALPQSIIIGTQKAGTSSLYSYLEQHPQLAASQHPSKSWVSEKEVHYFSGGSQPGDDYYSKGLNWYRSHFPLRKQLGSHVQAFEATPLYLFHPLAANRIRSILPDVKLLVLLRDPVERSISSYFHQVREQREFLPILEAFQEEGVRLSQSIMESDYNSFDFLYHSYLARSRYREQLDRYFALFPREQIQIHCSEDFFANPETVLRSIFEFLGVDPDFRVPNLEAMNVGSNRGKVDVEVYNYLADYFRPHNKALFELTGREFPWV
ncbi:sulfotransferase [Congregibacter variabilis]|uniref:Sulfotransferase n=1 Tax=Congregibacter variabilis TaxID=3081200 RepID=A0ABZ0I7C9_9GAMM|nr:sulfotransferase [Congregibacter sp. IMCC43200]